MASVNRVILVGNLGKDPEIRSTQSGDRIANLTLATSEDWTDKASGERKSRTEWHRVVIFNDGLVGVVEKYARKGGKLYLEGKLQTRKWTDQQGVEKYTTEITLGKFDGKIVLLSSAAGAREDDPHGGFPDPGPRTESSPGGATGAGRGRPGSMSDQAGARGPTWDKPGDGAGRGGGDLDDEIPFGPCWR